MLILCASVACNWSHQCIMGDPMSSRWGDLCSTRSLTPPFCLSVLETITSLSLSPSPAVHFPLSSSSSRLLSPQVWQPCWTSFSLMSEKWHSLSRSETQWDTGALSCFLSPAINSVNKVTGLLWWTHEQDVRLIQSSRNYMEEKLYRRLLKSINLVQNSLQTFPFLFYSQFSKAQLGFISEHFVYYL